MLLRSLLILFILLPPLAHSQSFDCKQASVPQEKAICNTPELAAADISLAVAYKNLRAQLSSPSAAKVLDDQRQWLRWIDSVCPPLAKTRKEPLAECLLTQYHDRLEQLKAQPQRVDGVLFFPRSLFLKAPDRTPPGERSSQDPGFGLGGLYWVEIDLPTPPQQAWNLAIRRAFASANIAEGKDPALDPSCVADCETNFYSTVTAVNARFIGVQFTRDAYCYGAHGRATVTSFLWWVDRQRMLAASDIFADGTHWKERLAEMAISRLKSNPDLTGGLWDAPELRQGVLGGVSTPKSWLLDRQGLTITFQQYEVAAYAFGIPMVTIPWSDLRPILAATFSPHNLPNPVPATKN